MENILDRLKNKFLQEKEQQAQREQQTSERMPEGEIVNPDRRQQAYLDAQEGSGLSEKEKIQKMVEESNDAQSKYSAKKEAEEKMKQETEEKLKRAVEARVNAKSGAVSPEEDKMSLFKKLLGR